MATFKPAAGLDEKVAWMVAPEVHRIARRVEFAAKRLAPPGKTWVHMGDRHVRDEHREAGDHPKIPGNLRFAVRGREWDIAHGLSPGVDYLLEPKDTSTGLPLDSAQHVNCRCVAALDPTFLSRQIKTGPYRVFGARVEVKVTCTAYKVVEAEFGDTYPTGIRAEGTRFMGRAAAMVAGQGRVNAPGAPGVGTGARVGGEDN